MHKCSACRGSGRESGGLGFSGDWAPGTFIACSRPCPACAGRGVISDRMPAQDALADAETLRRYLDSRVDGDGPYEDRSDRANAMRRALRQAEYQGHSGDALVASRGKRIVLGRWHARAAFRAVPGLKGE